METIMKIIETPGLEHAGLSGRIEIHLKTSWGEHAEIYRWGAKSEHRDEATACAAAITFWNGARAIYQMSGAAKAAPSPIIQRLVE